MNKNIENKLINTKRLLFLNSLTLFNNSVLVTEYPKSGGTWLGYLISSYLDIDFPKNSFPSVQRALYHGHYLPKGALKKNKDIIWLIRDGRDVIISLYYHQLFKNDSNVVNNPKMNTYFRNKLQFKDYDNIVENLPEFIEFTFTHKPSKLFNFIFPGNWVEFNNAWLKHLENKNITLVKYEDLLENTSKTLTDLFTTHFKIENLDITKLNKIVHTYSFKNQTKRENGVEDKNSFLRKGISGDWKNYYSEEAKAVFKKYASEALINFNYEQDNNW